MAGSDDLFGIHGTALALRAQRMAMIASNIANAATPNYKARDLDFQSALQAAEAGQPSSTAIRYRAPLHPSLDGNSVELAVEQTQFTENAVAYRTSLAFLQARVASVTRALKGE